MAIHNDPIRFNGWEFHNGVYVLVCNGTTREFVWQELAQRERTTAGKPELRVLRVGIDPNNEGKGREKQAI